MKNYLILSIILVMLFACEKAQKPRVLVGNSEELHQAIEKAKPGDEIVMKNGTWSDLQIQFYAHGTEEQPIVLKAESSGEVLVTGQSDLKLG